MSQRGLGHTIRGILRNTPLWLAIQEIRRRRGYKACR
jgi:hypothetical protein